MAHNLFREMQMMTEKRNRNENGEGKALWKFKEARTIHLNLLQRAGRLTSPQGKLHLSLSANAQTSKEITQMMRAFDKAACLRVADLMHHWGQYEDEKALCTQYPIS
jgi:hypothetical protein